MKILGISGLAHDAAVSLVVDGRPVFAVEEERLIRIKYHWTFPFRAIACVQEQTGVPLDEIDCVAFYFDTSRYNVSSFVRSLGMLRHETPSAFARHQLARYGFAAAARILPAACIRIAFIGRRQPPIRFIDHHRCHLASCYLPSGYEEAAVCVIDSVGEYPSTSLYSARGTRIENVRTICFPHSLGLVYTAVTEHLGFHPYGDEYKTMGLAAYGERNRAFADLFRRLIRLGDNGGYAVDTGLVQFHLLQNVTARHHLSPRAEEVLGPPRARDEPLSQRHRDIAFALQNRLEETVLHVLRFLERKTRAANLCMAGGVALNCLANRRVVEETGFRNVFIQPAAGDAGAALGAALYYDAIVQGRPRIYVQRDTFLGPSFDDERIEALLQCIRTPYRRVEDPARKAAELILDGKIVGWFQGRMEFGPRALGNRSLLCDPRREEIKVRLNRIKKREPFRPYAASVLADRMGEFFRWDRASPYMLFAVPVRPERRELIPAVVHRDGTCRIQTVDPVEHPLFYRLIETFGRHTGIPLVLNTSLNTRGEAIACTPDDAVRTFFSTPMDALFLGSYLLEKTAGTP